MNQNTTTKSDTALEAAEALRTIIDDLEDTTVVVCLAYGSPRETAEFGRLVLADALADDFRMILINYLTSLKRKSSTNDIVFVDYDTGTVPDHDYEREVFRVVDNDNINNQITGLANLQQVDIFTSAKPNIEKLKFYVIALQKQGQNIGYFLRLYTKTKEISQSKIAVLFQHGAYDRIREPVFIFDQKIDCFYSNGYLFIENRDNFQRIFRLFEEIRETAAAEALSAVQARLPVRNFDTFAEQCRKNLVMSLKLRNIVNRPYFENLTLDVLKRTIENQELTLQIEQGQDGDQLVFDPAKKWEFLRLLDDGFMTSEMTNTSYEVIGKRAR